MHVISDIQYIIQLIINIIMFLLKSQEPKEVHIALLTKHVHF